MGASYKSPTDKAITAALSAYRKADYATAKAFNDFEEDYRRARKEGIFAGVEETIRKAVNLAEAKALESIATAASIRAKECRRRI